MISFVLNVCLFIFFLCLFALECGIDVRPQAIIFFFENAHQDIFIRALTVSSLHTYAAHLFIFDQKEERNLIKTQVSQDWYLSKDNIIRDCLNS